MNPELEKLIDLALADGMLSDKEKQVLFKKAQALNVDQDEFEMVLEAKLHLAKKEILKSTPPPPVQETPQQPKTDKHGDMKKCPACGAIASSFSTRCQDCGHDFKNIEAANSVKKLFDQLNEIENMREEDSAVGMIKNFLGKGFGMGGGNIIDARKKELISNFPVPNAKEDILEFLSLALPKAQKQSISFFASSSDRAAKEKFNEFALIWKAKCEQIIMKARFAMKDDKKTLDEIEYYAKQIALK